jgi:predicted nucleic acid-binding protein
MAHLVDTDVLIDLATNNQGAIGYVNSMAEGWSVSIITALELIVGARDKKEVAKIDQFLNAVAVVPLTPAVGTRAYLLLKQFSRSHGLRVFDSLIAAAAIEENRTLLTRNEKHFRMIPDLEVPQY